MITIMNLLSSPIFSRFTLASGRAGLYNTVSGTGIFEWESVTEVNSTFEVGEFIVTTLSQAKGNMDTANQCLKILIDKKVSCIAIKSIYFTTLSDEIKKLSDERKVPIFFFSETFFDDIIFTIKTFLLSNSSSGNFSEQIHALLSNQLGEDAVRHLAKEINPFFFDHLLCSFISFRGTKEENESKLKEFQPIYCPQENSHWYDPTVSIYSLLPLNQGILVIYTEKIDPMQNKDNLTVFLDKLGLSPTSCHIGISNHYSKLEYLPVAIKESLYAHTSCLIDHEGLLFFDQTGLDQILIPSRNAPSTKAYYTTILERIENYDQKHQVGLMRTLLEYSNCGNDITLTAQRTFQHSNTIRYRLDKAKKTFGIEDNAEFHRQLYVFCRLHYIYDYLKF